MKNQAVVTYYHHSGFSVIVDEDIFIFDYWQGKDGLAVPEHLKLNSKALALFKSVYVFISHSHPDHLDQVVFEWKDHPQINYIVSYDMPIGIRGKRLAPGDSLKLNDNIRISAFDSTDLGVSFMLEASNLKIFHAGDLNLWHWREESSLREIEAAEEAYEKAMLPLNNQHIDLCMFPVDPRMGYLFDAGAQHFILATKPRVFIPMHWQNRPEVAQDFARRARNKHTEILTLTNPGEFAQLYFDKHDVRINTVSPDSLTSSIEKIERSLVSSSPTLEEDSNDFSHTNILKSYHLHENDPFFDSDMPVSLDDDDEKIFEDK